MLHGWNQEALTLTIYVDADDPSPVKSAQRTIAAAFDICNADPVDQWLVEVAGRTWRVKLFYVSLSLDLMHEFRCSNYTSGRNEEAINVFVRNL